jgi:hypothetical protein
VPGPILDTTRQTEIQSLKTSGGTPVFDTLRLIRAELRRSLSNEHAFLFAEPNADQVSGDIEWYSSVGGTPTRFTDLKATELADARVKIAQFVADISQHANQLSQSESEADRLMADNLVKALEIPNENNIYIVGRQPVITRWGHVPNGPAAPLGILTQLSAAPNDAPIHEAPELIPPPARPEQPPVPVSGPSGSDAFTSEGLAGPSDTPGRIRLQISGTSLASAPAVLARASWPAALLWLAFALLLLAIGYLLLKHCAIGWPGSLTWRPAMLNYCTAGTLLADDVARDDGSQARLLDQLAELDGKLAEKRNQCVLETQPPRDLITPPDSKDIIDRGGKIGAVNVILRWQTADDLDLYITCPNRSEINFSTPRGCGGTLDVDANVGAPIPAPAENVTWPADAAPPGEYTVNVHRYTTRSGAAETPFTVQLLIDGKSVEIHPQTAGDGKKNVFKFMLPYAGSQR